jgi:hypothetical protein
MDVRTGGLVVNFVLDQGKEQGKEQKKKAG